MTPDHKHQNCHVKEDEPCALALPNSLVCVLDPYEDTRAHSQLNKEEDKVAKVLVDLLLLYHLVGAPGTREPALNPSEDSPHDKQHGEDQVHKAKAGVIQFVK